MGNTSIYCDLKSKEQRCGGDYLGCKILVVIGPLLLKRTHNLPLFLCLLASGPCMTLGYCAVSAETERDVLFVQPWIETALLVQVKTRNFQCSRPNLHLHKILAQTFQQLAFPFLFLELKLMGKIMLIKMPKIMLHTWWPKEDVKAIYCPW